MSASARTLSSIAALVLIIGCHESSRSGPDNGPPPPRYNPRSPPEFPPVLADDSDCGSCGRAIQGLCRIVRTGYCPGGPAGVGERCEFDVPCDESCCDRFPLEGGFALVQPGRPLYENGWDKEHVEIGRVPKDTRGLLVRVTNFPEDSELVQIKTLGHPLPDACEGVADELRGVVLEAAVDPADLQPASPACTEVVYTLGDPEARENRDDDDRFDPTPYAKGTRVLQAWALLHHPPDADGDWAVGGRTIADLVLPDDEPLTEAHGDLCFRLPGRMRIRVCADEDRVHVIGQ